MDEYYSKYIVVHTPTITNYAEIMTFVRDSGYTWNGGRIIEDTDIKKRWFDYEDRTCVMVNSSDRLIMYSGLRFLKEKGKRILTMSMFYSMIGGNYKNILKDFR